MTRPGSDAMRLTPVKCCGNCVSASAFSTQFVDCSYYGHSRNWNDYCAAFKLDHSLGDGTIYEEPAGDET